MELFKLVCPNCGSNINLDRKTDACFCPYCGTKFILDDGTVHVNQTVTYRDEAKLRELELKEEERKRKEKEEHDAAQRQKEQNAAARKFKIWFFIIFSIIVMGVNYFREISPDKPNTKKLVSPDWYKSTAIVVPEVNLKEKTRVETKGPLQYEIPKSWKIGNTTVDASHSEYKLDSFAFNECFVTVDVVELKENSDNWDRETLYKFLDDKIRVLSTQYKLKNLEPMIIGGKFGVHGSGSELNYSTHPMNEFLVTSNQYYCYITLTGSETGYEPHLEEVYYLMNSMYWDFS